LILEKPEKQLASQGIIFLGLERNILLKVIRKMLKNIKDQEY
jgi:hypothetical protein